MYTGILEFQKNDNEMLKFILFLPIFLAIMEIYMNKHGPHSAVGVGYLHMETLIGSIPQYRN